MALLRCKMCGGQLDVSNQETVVTCEYCGSKQTLPVLDNEKKQNLFNRAHRLRLASEFDKASGVFESIVSEYPEEAEAYWGLVLCTFGIEYVDDPVTKKKIPTCHRTSYESIFNDVNYDLALEYASHEALLLYRKEAKEIDRLQKEILRIASNEEPFDVFICYKETSEDGQRTKDSVLAQDMYDHLTEKGYKVFFSRITLEDKLGQEYEPYIFSALNSAKVMLVVGTKYEHFNAVWVKNEWSRFLELTKKDKSKLLIPCYADVDAYDMPNEFRNLQGQDMNKIGFMQDLIRGIKKVIHPEETKEPVYEKPVQTQTGMSPLLKRAFIFLEDEKWEDANTYCERVLDEDPENAYAYLGELLSDLQIRKASELIHCEEPFDDEPNYQKILRFGDSALIEQISGYNQKIIERKENERLSKLYEKAVQAYDSASTILHYQKVIVQFDDILTYRDSKTYIEKCKEHIKDIQNSQWYKVAESRIDGTIEGYEAAIHAFKEIEHWKDVDDRIEFCLSKIEEIKQKAIEEQREKERQEQLRKAEIARIEEQKRIERELIAAENLRKQKELEEQKRLEKERREELKRIEEEKKEEARKQREAELLEAKRLKEEKRLAAEQEKIRRQAEKAVSENKKKPLILVLCLLLLIAGGLGTYFVLIPSMKYNEAITHLENQEYDEAYDLFVSLGDYKDSVQILNDFDSIKTYDYAKGLYDKNINASDEELVLSEVTEAKNTFMELGEFRNSQTLCSELQTLLREKYYLANVGDTICFGFYEQDGYSNNGKEAIEWTVLDRSSHKMLVISTKTLDVVPFSSFNGDISWENSYIREWAKESFYSDAFTDDDKQVIQNTHLNNSWDNDLYGKNDESSTNDYVFMLSIDEFEYYKNYLKNEDSWIESKPTEVAISKSIKTDDELSSIWWLRSSYNVEAQEDYTTSFITTTYTRAYLVNDAGEIVETDAYNAHQSFVGVRPVMCISCENDAVLTKIVPIEEAEIGDSILFGSYEQDGIVGNGSEDIEWRVLDKTDNRLLVISEYGLTSMKFGDSHSLWQDSTIYEWLNKSFLNNSFSNNERNCIFLNTEKASTGKIFLLSVSEANEYFNDFSDRTCVFSEAAKLKIDSSNLLGKCNWWLRTLGGTFSSNETYVAYVESSGFINKSGSRVYTDSIAVRPAMWITLGESVEMNNEPVALEEAIVGDRILFGSYEQDNNLDNGSETIEWRVLDKEDHRLLVISEYGLDCVKFNEIDEDVNWSSCTLRNWLNDYFYNASFSMGERELIMATALEHGLNDNVFILSNDEKNKYFSTDNDAKCKPSSYALNKGLNVDYAGNICWWLRTPGSQGTIYGDMNSAQFVKNNGSIETFGYLVNHDTYAVRPAMWIEIPE